MQYEFEVGKLMHRANSLPACLHSSIISRKTSGSRRSSARAKRKAAAAVATALRSGRKKTPNALDMFVRYPADTDFSSLPFSSTLASHSVHLRANSLNES